MPSGIAVGGDHLGRRVGADLRGDDDVDRAATTLPVARKPPAGVDLVRLQQRVADLVALRGEEREAHPAADQQPVDP